MILDKVPLLSRRSGPPDWEGASKASSTRRGGDLMPTYSELFRFCLVILGVISLVIQIINNKRK